MSMHIYSKQKRVDKTSSRWFMGYLKPIRLSSTLLTVQNKPAALTRLKRLEIVLIATGDDDIVDLVNDYQHQPSTFKGRAEPRCPSVVGVGVP